MTFLKCPDCGRGPIAHTLDATCRNPAFFSEALWLDALIWHGNPDAPRLAWDKGRVTHTVPREHVKRGKPR